MTDTTLRDAHQSLLATRMRTYDMLHDRRRLRPACTPSCSRWKCGAGRRSTRRCGSSRNARGSGWPSCASGCRTSCSRCCCGRRTPSATRTIPTTSCRRSSARRPRRASTCSASSMRSTGCRTCAWRWTPCARPARSAKRPSATPATSSTRSRTKYNLKYYVDAGQGAREAWARTSWPSRTWPGCASRTRREQLVQDAASRRSACRSTSTRTTPAACRPASILKAAEAGVDIADARDRPDVGRARRSRI